MERLTPQDSMILDLEDDMMATHGLTIGVFEGPEPSFDDVLERVAERVELVPRYRQRLLRVPFEIERPVWVDDPTFSLEFHVRHTALPKRKGSDPLNAFVSRTLSQRLDRGKPLWELWMVSGLPKKQWALVSKVHYAIIDGVSGADVLGLLADDLDVVLPASQRMPRPLPSPQRLLTDAIGDVMFDPIESTRATLRLARRPLDAARKLTAGVARAADPDSLGRVLGPHRKWQSAKVSLEDLRMVRSTHGCSTTDVVLAAVGGGIRSYLVANGKPLPHSVEVLVPLAVGAGSGGFSGQVTTLTARLPIAESDPVERLRTIHDQTKVGATQSGAIAGRVLRRQEDFVAPSILAQGVRATMLDSRNRSKHDTVAINVPGPVETIEVLGHSMVEAYPVIPLPGRVQLSMAAMSLRDTVYFGITSDFDSTQGLHHASAGVVSAIGDLQSY